MNSTPQLQIDLDVGSLDPREQQWLQAAEGHGRGVLIRELDQGVCYIALPCVGRLQRSISVQIPRWIIVLPLAAGISVAVATSVGVSGIGLVLLGVSLTVAMFGIAVSQILRGRAIAERWARDGDHGILLTPDAMVLRRPHCVSRIVRGGVLEIDDRIEHVDPNALDEDGPGPRRVGERVPVRRIRGRVSDGRSQFTVVFDEAQEQSRGVSDGLPVEERERMDMLMERLRRWHNGGAATA